MAAMGSVPAELLSIGNCSLRPTCFGGVARAETGSIDALRHPLAELAVIGQAELPQRATNPLYPCAGAYQWP